MYKHNDLTGKQFGRLRVVEQSGRTSDRHILWGCICACGVCSCTDFYKNFETEIVFDYNDVKKTNEDVSCRILPKKVVVE